MSSFDFRRESTRRISFFGKDLARLPPHPADAHLAIVSPRTRAPVFKSERRDDESRNAPARLGEVIRLHPRERRGASIGEGEGRLIAD